MEVTTPAIVISSVKYSEADLIVKLFTRSSGLKSYLLRNILKSRKGKLRASLFQPLTILEISAKHRDKGTLEYMKEARVLHSYSSLHTDVVKTSLTLFLSEILKFTILEEEQNESLFRYLETSFLWLDENSSVADFHLLFLLKLTDFLGFYPDASTLGNPVFNIQDGIFQKGETNPYCVNLPEGAGFRQLFGINFDDLGTTRLGRKERSEILDILLIYYQLHVQGFRKPKSLAVLNQLFS